MQAWSNGVREYFDGEYRRSLEHTNAALKIMPGFPDVERLRAEVQMRMDKNPRFMLRGKKIGFGFGVFAAVALLGVGARSVLRRRSPRAQSAVRRIDPEEIRRRLDAGTGVALVDARHGAAFEDSPMQAAGALRFDVDHPDIQSLQVRVNPDGEVVVYCD
jgi:hypothetical protein